MTDSSELWPATAGQEGIWLGAKIAESSTVYHTAEFIEIIGPLDRGRLKRAISHRVSEWPTLRPYFVQDGDILKVGAAPALDPLLPMIDVSDGPQPRRAALAEIEKLRAEPIAITGSAAVRFCLLRLGSHGHILAIISHHIALDGYSYGLLIKQLKVDYNAAASFAAAMPAVGSDQQPMARLAAERAAYEASAEFAADREFWHQELAGFGGHGKTSAAAFSDTILRVRVPVASVDADQITAICRESGCHWSLFWLAAGFLLTYRQTGERDIVLGVPLMPRMGSAALRIPSMTMNIVPVRLKICLGDSLVAVMARLKPKLARCSRHGRYRSEQLRRELPGMSPSVRLFAAVVNIMPFDYGATDFEGCHSESLSVASGPVEDSSIIIARRNGVLTVKVELNGTRYKPKDDKQMVEEFRQEWRSLIDAPALSLREREGYLSVMTAPTLDPPPQDVAEMIRAQGGADKVAIVAETGELSYDQLIARAQLLAAHLNSRGVMAGARVYTCLERRPAAIVALIACTFLGATFVPLLAVGGQSQQRQVALVRNRHIFTVCGEGAVIASREQLQAFDGQSRTVINVDSWYDEQQNAGWEEASYGTLAPHSPDLDAYILFTSGSTGAPKGVRISRGSLAAFAYGGSLAYELSSADRMLQFAPFHFDTMIEEVFCTLSVGGTLVLRTDELLDSPDRFIDFVARHGVTVIDLPTAYWHELVSFLAAAERRVLPHRVRKVIIGGEYANPATIRTWRRLTHATLYNSYGPTEATVVATVCKVFDDSQADSIGVPLPGRTVAIVDEELTPVPIGVKGQIAISGVLASGYLAAADRERFTAIDLPHGAGSQRVYLTGDFGVMTTAVQFAGRMDDEVKISGTRIHPAEVAAAIRAVGGVADAEVLRWQDGDRPARLAAFVVAAQGRDLTADGLRTALRATLPDVMVPAHIALMAELSVNSQGKIDRNALLAQLVPAEPQDLGSDAAATVQGIWAELLGQRRFRLEDDFFALGGTSLAAIQLANRLSIAFGSPCPVSLVFDQPRLADQIAAFSDLDGAGSQVPPASSLALSVADLAKKLSDDLSAERARMATLREHWSVENHEEGGSWLVLTGATGFVGRYILRQLLAASAGGVACLVRAATVAAAKDRLVSSWQQAFPAVTYPEVRVRIVLADLDEPDLGLRAEDRNWLIRHSGTIVHAGAKVRVMQSYDALRPANVTATGALLTLAQLARAKFLYVSTIAVAPPPKAPQAKAPRMLNGRDRFVDVHEGLKDGYQQTKWLGEQLVAKALTDGVNAKVIRVGRVCPAQVEPKINGADLFWQLAKSCIRLGCCPEEPMLEPWLPVDHFAATVAGLAAKDSPAWAAVAGPVIDALPVKPTDIAGLLGKLYKFGYLLTPMPYNEWLVHLATSAAAEDSQLYHILKSRKPVAADPHEHCHNAYASVLTSLAQPMAVLGDELFAAMVKSAQQAGILPS